MNGHESTASLALGLRQQPASTQHRQDRKDRALDQLTHEYIENIPKRNWHFPLGTIAAHPRNFIIIGLLRSPFDPQELARQGRLS